MNTTNTQQDMKTGGPTCLIAENNVSPSHSDLKSSEDVARVKELHSQLNKLGRKTFILAREAGEILCKFKEKTPHGEWEFYVKTDLGIEPRTASNYMSIWRNTSSYENIGEFLQSESVSDMGIREALDYFAEQKKSATQKADDDHITNDKEPNSTQAVDPPASLLLADESQLSYKNLNWEEGLISQDFLENTLTELGSTPDSQTNMKAITRQQRFVAEIAASINRCTRKAKPDLACKTAQAALETVIDMMSGINTRKKQG